MDIEIIRKANNLLEEKRSLESLQFYIESHQFPFNNMNLDADTVNNLLDRFNAFKQESKEVVRQRQIDIDKKIFDL